ncbi:MAG TPA: hypothetical protein VGG64_26195 [Pirellulales bacterium]
MARRLSFSIAAMVLTAVALPSDVNVARADSCPNGPYNPQLVVPTPICRKRACGSDYAVPYRRGVAILSPVESPDRCYYPVGGKTVYTHYYPDYCPHRKHGPRVCIPGNGYGYLAHGHSISEHLVSEVSADGSGASEYGFYAGARQDEANLLRLGGFPGSGEAHADTGATPDLIDMIEGRR